MNTLNQEQQNHLIYEASKRITAMQKVIDSLREPIAIVGMGCRFPEADNIDQYWKLLNEGRSGIKDRPEFHSYIDPYYDSDLNKNDKIYVRRAGFLDQDPADFDAEFFKIPAIEAASMDPQHRLVLEIAWEALEDAGIPPKLLSGTDTGVFIGICSNDYAWKLVKQDTNDIDIYLGSGNAYSPVSGRLSYLLDIHGPSFAIDTACSSSLTATHIAVNSLRIGECDTAIVGGIQRYLSPEYWMNLCKSRILSPNAICSSFSEEADGYVRGEGCGIIILKRLSKAQADGDRIYAVIAGSATGQDGKTSGLTVPNGASQQEVIKKALKNARLTTDDIDYIEAHGTATPIGDPIEMNALGNLFGKRARDLLVGTVKSNIGHLEGAAGIAGLIKVALSLYNKQIPKNLHFITPSSSISWDTIPIKIATELTAWDQHDQEKKRTAGINSFGFEGVNTHVILQEVMEVGYADKISKFSVPYYTITLSAKSQAALNVMVLSYIRYLEQNPQADLSNIAYTTNCCREHYPERIAIICSSNDDLLNKLKESLVNEKINSIFRSNGKKQDKNTAFLFTGLFDQSINVGRELYSRQTIFKNTFDICNQILLDNKLLDKSLLDVTYLEDAGKNGESDITLHNQLLSFSLEYSLSQLLLSMNVEPKAVLGSGLGEYTAACVAGIFSLEDALKLILAKGKLTKKLSLNTGLADSISAELEDIIQTIEYKVPTIDFISSMTGKIETTKVATPEYWNESILRPARFSDSMFSLEQNSLDCLVEIGHGEILLNISKAYPDKYKLCTSVVHKDTNEWQTLMFSLAQLYTQFIDIDWTVLYQYYDNKLESIPTYPWQRKRYWVE